MWSDAVKSRTDSNGDDNLFKRRYVDVFSAHKRVKLMMFFFALGGAITPVGDPPNVIVASNAYVIKSVSAILKPI